MGGQSVVAQFDIQDYYGIQGRHAGFKKRPRQG